MPPAATAATPPALAPGALAASAATAPGRQSSSSPSSSRPSGVAVSAVLDARGASTVSSGASSGASSDASATARDDAEPSDNDDPEPPPEQPAPVWSTSSLTLAETIADLRKGLAQLQQATPSSTTLVQPVLAETTADERRSTAAQAASMRMSSTRSLGRGGAQTTAADTSATDTTRSLFKVQPRFAMPVSPPSLPSTSTGDSVRRVASDSPDADRRGAQQGRANGASTSLAATSLTARRLVQLTGPGWPVGFQTAPAGSVSWSLDGVARPHGASPGATLVGGGPVGSGPGHGSGYGHGHGAPNMTGFVSQRGSVAGTLAGSLHGGVNVLLGGAMLSGLILLVFFICYCCQRSARKSDAHFRTQYWLPDPDGPLEVFTLDAQTQRLERAGAVLLPSDQLEVFVASPSPPPAYHTVVNLPPVSKPGDAAPPGRPGSRPASAGSTGSAASAGSECAAATDVLVKLPTSATCSLGLGHGLGELDADGLPSYEAALKLESQGHI